MAQYIGKGVSNIVKIKNIDLFSDLLQVLGCKIIHVPGEGYGFIVNNNSGEPVKYVDVEELGRDQNVVRKRTVRWTEAICEHLQPGEVLIFKHVGYEGDSVINGYAIAVSWKGQVDFVGLDDIYQKAQRKFNSGPIKML